MAGDGAGRQTLLRAPDQGSGRVGRMSLFAAAPLLLAGGAHAIGGGTLSVGGVALSAVVLLLISAGVSARRCRFPLLVGLLGVEQVLLHFLFTTTESAARCLPVGSVPAGHAGHGGAGGLDLTASAALQACTEGHTMGSGWSMITAHAMATVIVSWLLARGEAWWWRAVAELVRIVSARPTRRRHQPALIVFAPRCLASRSTLSTASPRGPPLPF